MILLTDNIKRNKVTKTGGITNWRKVKTEY